MLPEHIARHNVLQVSHSVLKNAAHCVHALRVRNEAHSSLLCLAVVFLYKGTTPRDSETKCCTPAGRCSAVPSGPRRGDTVHQNEITKLTAMQHLNVQRLFIHTLQPSCDAPDATTYWQVNPKGHLSQLVVAKLFLNLRNLGIP